jgi:predicted metalloprotease with PDZ domain
VESKSRVYWIVGAIAAGGVILSLVLGAAAGGAAGYYFGKRAASDEVAGVESPSTGRFWQMPQAQITPMPRGRATPGVEAAAELTMVVESGPAAQAGLRVGDLITSVGKSNVTVTADLSQLVRQYKPGDSVTITFLRDSAKQSVQVTLGEKQGSPGTPYLGVEYRMNLEVGG